jgi:ABC-type glycerol-3-phosphate transport system permease component
VNTLGGHQRVSKGGDLSLRDAAYSEIKQSAFISMALPLLVFFSLQRYFVRGILTGSVKG